MIDFPPRPFMGLYILVDGQPKAIGDIIEWGLWFEAHDEERPVGRTSVGGADVSTVFLGIDHGFHRGETGGGGEPVLWETMIFGGPEDGYQERYTSLAEALAGHARAVEIARVANGWLARFWFWIRRITKWRN
jgi:hypothetical protein